MPACPTCGEDNPERARFCWSCGAAVAEAPRSGAEERKIVSVLFVDLSASPLHRRKPIPRTKRWADYGFVFGRGLALLGSARCLLALGRRTDATPVLHQARDIFAALEAAPALAEVDALLGDQPAAARAAK